MKPRILYSKAEECKSGFLSFITYTNIRRAIFDARVAFEARYGSLVIFSFTIENQLKSWPKLAPPSSLDALELVAKVANERIRAYY